MHGKPFRHSAVLWQACAVPLALIGASGGQVPPSSAVWHDVDATSVTESAVAQHT